MAPFANPVKRASGNRTNPERLSKRNIGSAKIITDSREPANATGKSPTMTTNSGPSTLSGLNPANNTAGGMQDTKNPIAIASASFMPASISQKA
jgi:hypothetical protein